MLAENRRRRIIDAVTSHGSVSITELARRFDVSIETIRRDIKLLDRQGQVRRTHGGALSVESFEPAFGERIATNVEGKRAIGRVAAALVPDGASVILDFGTTAYCVAEALAGHSGLTVFTAGVQAASYLAGRNGNEVYLLGGQFMASEGAAIGRDATAMLERYFADFSFVGAGAISSHPWLMDFSREAAELRALMLLRARNPVVLADHSKFDRVAIHMVPHLEKARYLIVDKKLDKETARALRRLQAEVLVAANAPMKRPGRQRAEPAS